ncbi:MAG: LamG domain-containing protein [Novipirellula sp. JB048]
MRLGLLWVVVAWVAGSPIQTSADDGLVAHWKLDRDAKDSSSAALHAKNHGVVFEAPLSRDDPPRGARFDGRTQYLEVDDASSLDFGTAEFSVAMWVHTERSLDDLPGNLLSKYDPKTRRGFQLSIDSRPGVTSSQSNAGQLHFGIDNAKSEAKWTDHGRLGNAVLVYAMAVHEGQLFAGTCVAGEEAGRVYRFDGEGWTDCGAPDRCNAVSSLAVYRGQLYAGVSKYRLSGSSLAESQNAHLGGKIYRYVADGRWEFCGLLPEVEAINGMVVFRDQLYASSMYAPAGFFRYEGGTQWISCGTPDGKRVEALGVYNGHLYASGYDEGAVYRYDGQSWASMGQIGEATQTYGFAVHRGELYVSEWPHAKVYRFAGPKDWVFAGRAGQEKETMPLAVYNGKMYVGTLPSGEVYRFDEGSTWTQVGRLDLTPDVRYRRVWSMAVFQGRLFAGTLPSGRVHSIEVGKNVTHDTALRPGWRHIVAVKGAQRLRLFVDGKLVASSSSFDPADFDLTNDEPLKIGFGAHDYFNGRLRDLRIYNRALTPQEIADLAGK